LPRAYQKAYQLSSGEPARVRVPFLTQNHHRISPNTVNVCI